MEEGKGPLASGQPWKQGFTFTSTIVFILPFLDSFVWQGVLESSVSPFRLQWDLSA